MSVLAMLIFPAYADNYGNNYQLSATSLLMRAGQTSKLSVTVDSMEALGITWSSSNPSVVTVDSDGNVKAVSWGQSTITAHYPDGASANCNVNVAVKGVDVSQWQTSVDWAAVKNAGYDFAMIRTGYGNEYWSTQTDQKFETYYNGAVQNGLKVGAYHYSYATNATMAEQEAEFCLHVLNGRHLDMPVAYDVEDGSQWGLSTDTMGSIVEAFCSKIQAAGYKTVVYSYVSFYNNYLTSPKVSQYDTWIANTGGLTKPSFSRPYTMWQYAETDVPGVQGSDNNKCDVDYCYKDYPGSFTSTGGGGTATEIPPGPKPPTDPTTFQCDTTSTYTFGNNSSYCYKIRTADTMVPSASSSNPSAVTVSYAQRLSDGFLFRITNVGPGQATITTTAADGRSVSFEAVSNGNSSIPPSQSGMLFQSDTTAPYTFGNNSVYTYKITTDDTAVPTAVSSNPAAVTVAYDRKTSGGYLFRITNAGKGNATITTTSSGGKSVSFQATGTWPGSAGIISDTPAVFSMQRGKTYQFKFTAPDMPGLSFSTGNGSVIRSVSVVKSGSSWYYKILAVGRGSAGVYASVPGRNAMRECVVTVS